MMHRRLASGTNVRIGKILITDTFGNMKITIDERPSNTITIERADIDDLATALSCPLAEGGRATVGSILVARVSGNLKISMTHTPSHTITVEHDCIGDFTTAFCAALRRLV